MNGLSVVLVCAGAWLLVPGRSRGRLASARRGRGSAVAAPDLAAVLGGIGAALLIGGLVGLGVGVVVALGARVGLRRLSTVDPEVAEDLARQAPDAVDCLASCLAAGAPLWSGIAVVADAFGDPIAGVFRRCAARQAMGSTYGDTFAELIGDPVLAPVGRVLLRSVDSGGALTRSLVSCADQMRQERAAELERRARAVGVKAVAPLGLCFLPAFVLLAVVPIVGSMVQNLF
ncbi:MAG: type II secretion system F family protein [Candidatus Nanopelagicales bacterium]